MMALHPHARGFDIVLGDRRWRLPLSGEPWPIPIEETGDQTATVATVTDFGAHGRNR
jgi:hypothetical protein